MAVLAGVPERPKGAGCKPAGSAYEGSNPSPCILGAIGFGICGSRSRTAPRPLKGRLAPFYLRKGTGKARARAKTPEGSLRSQGQWAVFGRLDLGGLALLAQLVEHLHGKEGVDGSSPSEGFT